MRKPDTADPSKMILEVTTVNEPEEEAVPLEFKLGSVTLGVCEILDRWLAEDHSYFKLRADDEAVYILRHDKPAHRWELILFNRRDF